MKTLASLCLAAVFSLTLLPSAQAKAATPHHTATAPHAGAKASQKTAKKTAGKGPHHAGAHALKKTAPRKHPRRVASLAH